MLSRGRLVLTALCTLVAGRGVGAQTVLDRTPNLAGGRVSASEVLHFNFLHRFSISSAPERKVTSAPTFLLAAGLPARTLLGVNYATNSELSPRYPLHTVSAEDGSFESGSIEPGERRSIAFSRAGTFPFHCTPHPFTTGMIVVR
jgi:hypothetical protein